MSPLKATFALNAVHSFSHNLPQHLCWALQPRRPGRCLYLQGAPFLSREPQRSQSVATNTLHHGSHCSFPVHPEPGSLIMSTVPGG